MHKDIFFWPVYNFKSLVVYTSFVIGAQYSGGKENRDLENCRLFSKGFSKYVLLVLLHVWEFYSPQLNCSCLDFFALHDLIDMSVMYTYIFMLENWEEERIFTQRFIKLPSPPVNCIGGKNLIIITIKMRVKNFSLAPPLLLRVYCFFDTSFALSPASSKVKSNAWKMCDETLWWR